MKPDSVCFLLGTQSRPTICCLIGSGESGAVAGLGAVAVEKASGDEHTKTHRGRSVLPEDHPPQGSGGCVLGFCANSLFVVQVKLGTKQLQQAWHHQNVQGRAFGTE